MKIRIAGVIENSFVDGDGVRFAIFTQGCQRNCKGCQNPMTHDFNGGKIFEVEEVIKKFQSMRLISGITLTGGEPLCQIKAVTEIVIAAKKFNLSVWCYTGYTFENLIDENFSDKFFTADEVKNFLNYVDVLVDGAFIESQKDLTLQFRGSTNQRLIDVQRSLDQKKIVEWALN